MDKDYYPEDYLEEIKQELNSNNIKLVFTPGKETENIFLDKDLFLSLLPDDISREEFELFLTSLFKEQYNTALGSLIELHEHFPIGANKAATTIIAEQRPIFDKNWSDDYNKFNLIQGKKALASIRSYFKRKYSLPLPNRFLVEKVAKSKRRNSLRDLVKEIYQV